ncbi:MAG: beta-lactamase family protein [Urechidicola sp.]|nr:beta-lactamase family protein [Urechidicola sp.]
MSKGVLVATEIKPTDKHRYKIKLKKNKFAFFKLMQKQVDVKITTFDTDGEKIDDFDSPNGKNGAEYFTITSTNKGVYEIEVSPIDEKQAIGVYDLVVESIKPKARTAMQQVDELFTPWDQAQSPGAAVAVVKDGKIVYKKGYGLANLEYDIPVTSSSIFHIASVSKQFTVFSILLLEKQGKLSLDDDIRKYIPEVPDFGKTITLRHLASHTSGLRDQWNLLSMAGWRMDDVITKEHVLKLVAKQTELNFDPGEEYLYCNTGFTLLAEVVSRITDKTFAEFTKTNIFDPLNMNNTLFYDDHQKVVKNRVYSYYSDESGYKKSVLNYANVGATSLFTTVEDLSLWSINFSELKVGDENLINTMNTPAILNDGETFGGALGQFVGDYKGLKEIQHGGGDAGYRTYLTRFPEENFSVIVFGNSAEFNSAKMAHNVVDIYLKDKLVSDSKKQEKKTDELNTENPLEQLTINQLSGHYELQTGVVLEVSIKDEIINVLQSWNKSTYTLTNTIGNTYEIPDDDSIQFTFSTLKDDFTQLVTVFQNGQDSLWNRIDEVDLSKIKLKDFTGEFYSEELSTTYKFEVVDEQLVATHSRLSDFNINPIKEDIFRGEAWYFGTVEFIRDSDDVITGFTVTNGRVRNLYFEKVN